MSWFAVMYVLYVGKPALLDNTCSPDWAPSVNLGPGSVVHACEKDVEPHTKKRRLSDTDWTTSATVQSVGCQTDFNL